MKKVLELKIAKKGRARGTVGWLAANAKIVSLGKTSDGRKGAWLYFVETADTDPIALVLYDFYETRSNDYTTLARQSDCGEFGLDFAVTDACWESIAELANIAKKMFVEQDADEKPIKFKLEVSNV